jgi:hypothetical protein
MMSEGKYSVWYKTPVAVGASVVELGPKVQG